MDGFPGMIPGMMGGPGMMPPGLMGNMPFPPAGVSNLRLLLLTPEHPSCCKENEMRTPGQELGKGGKGGKGRCSNICGKTVRDMVIEQIDSCLEEP